MFKKKNYDQLRSQIEKKFSGDEGRKRIHSTLLKNPAILGDSDASEFVIQNSTIKFFCRNAYIITQSEMDDDVYFLIFGDVYIIAHGEEIAVRHAPNQVGEMAAMSSNSPRSASVKVLSPCLAVAMMSSEKLNELLDNFPDVKSRMFDELSNRHRQRIEEVKSKSPPKQNKLFSALAAIFALAVLVLIVLALPGEGLIWKLAIGLIAAIWVFPFIFMRGPQYKYYRLICALVFGTMGLAMTQLDFFYDGILLGSDHEFSIQNNISAFAYLVLGAFGTGLIFLEFKNNNKF